MEGSQSPHSKDTTAALAPSATSDAGPSTTHQDSHPFLRNATYRPDISVSDFQPEDVLFVVRMSSMVRPSEHILVCLAPDTIITADAKTYTLQPPDFAVLLNKAREAVEASKAVNTTSWKCRKATCQPWTRLSVREGNDAVNRHRTEAMDDTSCYKESGDPTFHNLSVYAFRPAPLESLLAAHEAQRPISIVPSETSKDPGLPPPVLVELLSHVFHMRSSRRARGVGEECWVSSNGGELHTNQRFPEDERERLKSERGDAVRLIHWAHSVGAKN